MKGILTMLLLVYFSTQGIAQRPSNSKEPSKQKKYDARVTLTNGKIKSGRVVQYTRDSLYLDSIGNAIHFSRIQKIRLMRANQLKIFRNINPMAGTKNYVVKGEQSEYNKVISKMDSVKPVMVNHGKTVQENNKKINKAGKERRFVEAKQFAQ